jgi:hypothetical protein
MLYEGAEFRLVMAMHSNMQRTIDYDGVVINAGFEIEKISSHDLVSR